MVSRGIHHTSRGAAFWRNRLSRRILRYKIRPLDAEDPRRIGDSAMMVLEHGRDVIAFELRARLPQRRIQSRRAHGPFELRMRQDVLEPDQAARREQNQPFQQPPELGRVAAPRQRRQERQRRARERLHRLRRLPGTFPSGKWVARTGMSSRRCRSAGTSMRMSDSRSWRSSRSRPSSTAAPIALSTEAIGRTSSGIGFAAVFEKHLAIAQDPDQPRLHARRQLDDVLEKQDAARRVDQTAVPADPLEAASLRRACSPAAW